METRHRGVRKLQFLGRSVRLAVLYERSQNGVQRKQHRSRSEKEHTLCQRKNGPHKHALKFSKLTSFAQLQCNSINVCLFSIKVPILVKICSTVIEILTFNKWSQKFPEVWFLTYSPCVILYVSIISPLCRRYFNVGNFKYRYFNLSAYGKCLHSCTNLVVGYR